MTTKDRGREDDVNEAEVMAARMAHRSDQVAAELADTASHVAAHYRSLVEGGIPPEGALELTHVVQDYLLSIQFREVLGDA